MVKRVSQLVKPPWTWRYGICSSRNSSTSMDAPLKNESVTWYDAQLMLARSVTDSPWDEGAEQPRAAER